MGSWRLREEEDERAKEENGESNSAFYPNPILIGAVKSPRGVVVKRRRDKDL